MRMNNTSPIPATCSCSSVSFCIPSHMLAIMLTSAAPMFIDTTKTHPHFEATSKRASMTLEGRSCSCGQMVYTLGLNALLAVQGNALFPQP